MLVILLLVTILLMWEFLLVLSPVCLYYFQHTLDILIDWHVYCVLTFDNRENKAWIWVCNFLLKMNNIHKSLYHFFSCRQTCEPENNCKWHQFSEIPLIFHKPPYQIITIFRRSYVEIIISVWIMTSYKWWILGFCCIPRHIYITLSSA